MARQKQRAAQPTFEESLLQLEKIVQKLEEAEVPLEASLQYYADGLALIRACEDKLKAAENRIRMLTEDPEGHLREEPMESLEDNDDSGEDDEDRVDDIR